MLTELQERKQTHYFNLLDVNRSGSVDAGDLETIAENLAAMRGVAQGSSGYEGIRSIVGAIWENLSGYVDTDGDGRATLQEWLKFEEERVVGAGPEAYDSYVNTIVRSLVDLFDADGDGVISAEEYRDILVSFRVEPRHAAAAFGRLDTDGDGRLSKEEVLRHVEDFHRSDDPNAAGNWLFGPY